MPNPSVLPTGTRYTSNGVEYELLGPSVLRDNGTYSVPDRRYVATGHVSLAPLGIMAEWQSLEIESVKLPEPDPYVEHRKKIGEDK